ncbi:hypothetical protein [Streptomyces chiangmaiensis]|uniref:Uncharacterized protein n=1 Tax=Streptomyces chiangmaiensis TaxID=766497 RepID=A0ABU7FVS1_9ACTN|nr:hypothetical protein [Streptomyces chiangmaiensis]MED7827977.1 hypothetical protein [Streptomyces chiangmaiensis]
MSHWVYVLSGYPDSGTFQQLVTEGELGTVVVRERSGGRGIVDGFVRENVYELMMVACFRWVASGEPSTVMPALREASGLPPTPDGTCWP